VHNFEKGRQTSGQVSSDIPHRDSVGHVVHFHSFRKTHASFAARYGVAQKATQEVLGHSDANLTANVYTEMGSESIRSELRKFPWIDEKGVKFDTGNDARIYARVCGSKRQTVSFPDKPGKGENRSKYVDSPLKRRVLAALDTLCQNVEMVDATGLEPVTPCV
jgi:hypothetical protein